MQRLSYGLLGGVAALWAMTAPQSAQALDWLHAQRNEGGRVCMVDHYHDGSSSGHATRAAAERDAIGGWSSFTALEYGNHWGSWRIAGSRSMNCSQSAGGWGCQVSARPCRPGRVR